MVVIVRSLRWNLAANFLSRAWIAIIQVLTFPYLLKILGPEGFGLIGVFLTLQVVANIFESAFSTATNREISQRRNGDPMAIGDVLRFHIIAGTVCGILLGGAVILLAPLLAAHWVAAGQLPLPVIMNVLMLMGCAVAVQVATGSAFGALLGRDRQTTANLMLALWGALRTVGALMALLILDGGPVTYFAAQLAGLVVYAILTFAMAVRDTRWSLGRPARHATQPALRLRIVGGMIGSGLIGTPLNQLDRIMLALWGGLAEQGYYAFASSLAGIILYVSGPVVQASFPALAASLGGGDRGETGRIFRVMTEVMTVGAGLVALIFSLFGQDIIGLWTGDPQASLAIAELLPYLMIGAAAHAIYFMPLHLQLATGGTKPLIVFNAIALAVMVPAMLWLVTQFGAIGAASGSLVIKVAALLCLAPAILRPLLAGGAWLWWRDTILPTLLGILPGALLGRVLISSKTPAVLLIAEIGLATMASLVGGVLAAPDLRGRVRLIVRGRFKTTPPAR